MLPRRDLLEGSRHPEELGALFSLAETALRTWEPQVSGFLEAAVREEAQDRLGGLSELSLASDGGHPGAERRCLLLARSGQEPTAPALLGLEISGNFLFDPASAADMAEGLAAAGAGAAELGDLWLRGDRGGQAIVSEVLAVDDVKERAIVLSRLIMLAEELKNLHNFHTAMSVVAGLNAATVIRLRNSWSLLPSKIVAVWDALQQLFSPESNSINLRNALVYASPPAIPYIGLFMKDLTFIEDGNQDDVNGLINFNKRTLAVLLGLQAARWEYVILVGGAYVAVVVMVITGVMPPTTLIVAVTLPEALKLIQIERTSTDVQLLHQAQGRTAKLHGRFGLWIVVGWFAWLLIAGVIGAA